MGPGTPVILVEGLYYVINPLRATGGTGYPNYTWTATNLPPGISFDSQGNFAGMPRAGSSGTYQVGVTVKDTGGHTASLTFPIQVIVQPISVTPATLPNGTITRQYGPVTLRPSGGRAPYYWSVSGNIAGWMKFTLDGDNTVLTGLPGVNDAGDYSINFDVEDSAGVEYRFTRTLTILSKPAVTDLSASCSPVQGPIQVGVAYSVACQASGGTLPYAWSLSGSLPAGLVFNSYNGSISGTPSSPGSYSYSITVTDSGQPAQSVTRPYSGTIGASSLTVTPGSLAFSAQSGTAPPAQTLSIAPGGLSFLVTTATAGGCSWLDLSPTSGSTPAVITLSVRPSGLPAGSYSCSLNVSAGGSSRSIAVTLTVTHVVLGVNPPAAFFLADSAETPPLPQTLSVTASSGGAVSFTATASCAWLKLVQSSPATPGDLTLTADPAGLSAGTYTCPLTILSPDASEVPQPVVTLRVGQTAVKANPQIIFLNAPAGSATPVLGSLALTGADAPIPISATAGAITGGDWLTVDASSDATPARIGLRADPSGLAAGTYAAMVHIVSDGDDLPVPVYLTVAPVGFHAVPPALSFRYDKGSAPQTQLVSVLASDGSTPSFTFEGQGDIYAVAGPAPGSIKVFGLAGVSPSNTLTITGAGANAPREVVPVTVIVDPVPSTPVLSSSPVSLAFSLAPDAPAASQLLLATNRGGDWMPAASVTTSSGGDWLRVSALPATASSNAAVPVLVVADPARLASSADGLYSGEVVLSNSGGDQSVHIPVTLTVSAAPAIALSRTGLSFTTAGSSTLDLFNPGPAALNWTATASGADWLNLPLPSGSLASGSSTAIPVNVDAAATGTLDPGVYSGSVEIHAWDSDSGQEFANSPKTATVVLNIAPPALRPGPAASPGALVFSGAAGGDDVPTQAVALFTPGAAPVAFTAAALSDTGVPWCSVTPATGTLSGSASLAVAVAPGSLNAGVHHCSVRISFADGTARTVDVLAVMGTPYACATPGLVVSQREPSAGALLHALQPVALEVEVRDGCGMPLDDAAALVSLVGSSEAVALRAVGNGLYRAAWTPGANPDGVPQAAVLFRASVAALRDGSTVSGSARPVDALVTVR